ncbi:MAG: hypothetical protein A2391_00025 [Candidatus Brennerbacteria bacterium RIFOXYB1_FULL_41_13]|uniref:tRNA/rRNA methyltransferase SpoU type domain-containing protein n=1 Tax=Candidatus Brennerbacteria bacterium RIFOXYD1_FULL_41_16 TaxID=1797529 RepID=A0A1G1XKR0_9BACT|nr:MAG: hypothetical protein A2391_00025 [Candidatus Brennerbacteria bacterium RIFOXYB1_FULL_41_13]OGY40484.1 MAG: hypothetical protein A2570_01915 [Candidatus Brennerbacteria bacterium RIFOXYD1_FULL_41_16]
MRFIVILDNLRSAHNVGSIFRTADALGCEKIYLCGTTPTPSGASLSVTLKAGRELVKTALGAEKNIPWEYKKRISDPLKFLKKQNFQIIALEQDKNAIDIRRLKVKASGKIALVLGYEVKGVSKSVLKQCDKITEIPMFGKKESLNVAVAFGIVGYWIKLSERKE